MKNICIVKDHIFCLLLACVIVISAVINYDSNMYKYYIKELNRIERNERLLQENKYDYSMYENNASNEEYIKPDLGLYSKSALLMDYNTKRVIFEKDGYNKMAMASTTKIMTCIYTIENGNLDDVVTISKNAANQPKVRLGLCEGQQYKLRDLLYALMLESYNDCAVAIAEHIGGSVENFCAGMTSKARDIGAKNTNFVTPNGLDANGHYTTAYDLALITQYALSNEDFVNIINTGSYSFNEITGGQTYTANNKDAFLNQYEGAIGVKTGFTGDAGYCFVGAVKIDDKELISVVLAAGWPPNKSYKWSDTRKLMDYGINNFSSKNLIDSSFEIKPVKVVDGINQDYEEVYIKDNVDAFIAENEKVTIKIDLPLELKAPIEKDLVVGQIEVYINNELYKKINIYTKESIRKKDYQYYFERVLFDFLG